MRRARGEAADEATVLADIRRHLDGLAVHVPYVPNTLKCRIDFPNGGTIILMRLDEKSDFEKLRGIEFLDVVMEGRENSADAFDAKVSFDADVALATGELRQVIDDVVAALGGEVVATEGGEE